MRVQRVRLRKFDESITFWVHARMRTAEKCLIRCVIHAQLEKTTEKKVKRWAKKIQLLNNHLTLCEQFCMAHSTYVAAKEVPFSIDTLCEPNIVNNQLNRFFRIHLLRHPRESNISIYLYTFEARWVSSFFSPLFDICSDNGVATLNGIYTNKHKSTSEKSMEDEKKKPLWQR